MKRLLFFCFLTAIAFTGYGQSASEAAIFNSAQQAKPYIVLAKPSSQSLAATGSIQWTGQPGGTYILTVTHAPGATAAFVATVQFESSPDGTTWTAVNASPLIGLPGAGQAVVTSTTAAGMWQIQLTNASSGSATAPVQHFFRARVSAYTSGTIWFYFEPQTVTNKTLMMPWTPTVTSGQTLSGWIDASGISELNIQVSAITTTVVTAQGTDDPTGTAVNTVPVNNDNSANQANTATITTAGKFLVINPSYKWIRLQVTTTGTVLTVQGVIAKYGQNIKLNPNQSTIGLNGGTISTLSTLTTLSQFLASAAAGDATANPTTTGVRGFNQFFNSSTWDRAYNNYNTTVADNGVRTTSFAGATATNFNARGAVITIVMGAVTGTTPTFTPQLQYSFDGGTTWVNYGPAMTTITASGQHTLIVYPANVSQTAGATPANFTTGAASTVVVNAPLPRTWRLNYTIGGTTPSFTVTSVNVSYLN